MQISWCENVPSSGAMFPPRLYQLIVRCWAGRGPGGRGSQSNCEFDNYCVSQPRARPAPPRAAPHASRRPRSRLACPVVAVTSAGPHSGDSHGGAAQRRQPAHPLRAAPAAAPTQWSVVCRPQRREHVTRHRYTNIHHVLVITHQR